MPRGKSNLKPLEPVAAGAGVVAVVVEDGVDKLSVDDDAGVVVAAGVAGVDSFDSVVPKIFGN